ncbi:DNA/RNA-binding protein Alba-like protein [Artemisia annua]|uniref:DNA/RNA-binding protein Alba-like protein n=1 Tax=Artemisia annua TaxID=35608 RepID=A0A2U1PBG7_ARTAN|nr:DNA/RNA-binding protein Alba-like protein [Artemisia annua]PWA83088.1 DNA/RNA-binding protein Alba-like protein [Artemisia annua]
MDRYTKVEQKKEDVPINENEIRITSQGLVRNYISYASTLLLQERRGKEIVLKAMGQAISKTVAIAEILKRNIPQLHQDTHISSISITDVWEPIEEGLLPVEMTRQVSMISITLSTKELDKSSPGYQAPLPVERPRPHYNNYQRQPPRQAQQAYNAVKEESYGGNYHENRDRSQVGGRGGRGRGWNRGGGYGNQGGSGYGNQGGGRYGNQGGGGYGNQGGGRYGNQGGGYGNYEGDGYRNYQGGGGYSNYQGGRGYGNSRGGRGYGNYHDRGDYGNYQDNNGYSNRGRGGNAGYRGGGYMRGGNVNSRGSGNGGAGGRFNGRGRGRMGGRPRDGGDSQQQ